MRIPAYLTQTNSGLFIFQYRIPVCYKMAGKVIRLSLKTSVTELAIYRSRILLTMLNDIAATYFDNTKSYAEAKKIFVDLM